jgi:flagella basal body P-ring formation protein FlgA
MSASFTEVYGRVILGVFVVAVLLAIARAAFAAPVGAVTPIGAIEQAVSRRLGGAVRVSVTGIETNVAAQQGMQALPEPGARAGQPVRFVLMKGRSRLGVAVATVIVSGPHAVASRAIARDEAITEADVAIVNSDWPSLPLTPLPSPGDVVGLRARRHIAAGEALTAIVLDVPPLVRSGDVVNVSAVVGAVRVTGVATASNSGHRGDIIRVTPKPNGARAIRARILSADAVEVVQ